MHIRLTTPADQSAWDAYVTAHPGGFAYHRYAWRQAVEQAYGHKGVYLVAESAGAIRGVLPMIVMRVPLRGNTLSSLPYCDIGGPLADSAAIAAELLAEARRNYLPASQGKYLELRTLPNPEELPRNLQESAKVLLLLDLPASSTALLAGLKAKLRSQVNKPLRDGLTAKLGGPELLPDFYPVFARNMRDLGSPVHSRQWFDAILNYYGAEARIGIIHTPSGEPAAGGILLQHARTVSVPWASALRTFNHLNANMLLYWTFLAYAADHGFTRFDFGRSTPGEGTCRFKQQWGAEPMSLDWQALYTDGRQEQSVATHKGPVRTTIESIWRQLPLPLCNLLGPKIRRYVNL